MIPVGIYLSDGRADSAPVVIVRPGDVLPEVIASAVSLYTVPCGGVKRNIERILPELGFRVAAAIGAAVGHMAVGFVIDDFALKKIADEFVGEIAEFVGTRRQVDRENVSVLVRNGVRG
jgi:hypothetical protein